MADSSKACTDVYDEEFYNNLTIAKNLIEKLRIDADKKICRKWIGKLVNIESNDPVVKKNRNEFFKYMINILTRAVEESGHDHVKGEENKIQTGDNNFMRKWSADKRTYIAAKPIPGQGTLVYMAVASDPNLGWDHP